MEARGATAENAGARVPAWALGLAPIVLAAAAIAIFVALGAPGLGDRTGPPVEELAIERTVLHPGEIELTVRNDGPDPVELAQISVDDAFAPFATSDGRTIGRLGSTRIDITYPWIEGEAYSVSLITATGATIDHEIPVATETPEADAQFFGLMALLGVYVGVIPVSLGLLWLPFVRRIGPDWLRLAMAFTVGLLGFLAVDAWIEGSEIADAGPSAFGGTELVVLGAIVAFLTLMAVDAYVRRRHSSGAGLAAGSVALMVAIGIGLHNLGEGLAIGSAYATGALALGAFLVVGFAIHNTTEGLAIAAPLARERARFGRLALLGLIAGAPAIVGAWIGAGAFNPSAAALLFGVGVGAILQVIWQLLPSIRDAEGRLDGRAAIGLLAGVLTLYLTGLLVNL
jgi:zinc transporter ZupT